MTDRQPVDPALQANIEQLCRFIAEPGSDRSQRLFDVEQLMDAVQKWQSLMPYYAHDREGNLYLADAWHYDENERLWVAVDTETMEAELAVGRSEPIIGIGLVPPGKTKWLDEHGVVQYSDSANEDSASAALDAIEQSRPCLDADTTDADLAEWVRQVIIPTLERRGKL